MTEQERNTISLVANIIEDGVRRMCVAKDLVVIDDLYVNAHNNLENLHRLVQEANSEGSESE